MQFYGLWYDAILSQQNMSQTYNISDLPWYKYMTDIHNTYILHWKLGLIDQCLLFLYQLTSFRLRFLFGQHTSAACPSAMMLLSLWFWGHCCKQDPSPLFLAGVRRLLELSLDLFLEETLFTLISCFSAFITDQQHQLSHQPPDAALNSFSQLTNHMFKTKRHH